MVGIRITKGFDPITLISVYVPPGPEMCGEAITKIKDLFEQVDSLHGEILIGGDFNGHHSSWDLSSPHCPKGNAVNSALQAYKHILLNDGPPTCMSTSNNNSTAIDLSLATAGLTIK